MHEKRLISSYDEENDIFVGKIDGRNGFCCDYDISDGVFLTLGNDNLPSSVFVSNASEVLNTSKEFLENSDIRIGICCDSLCLDFNLCIGGLNIFSARCPNSYGIPEIELVMDSNI